MLFILTISPRPRRSMMGRMAWVMFIRPVTFVANMVSMSDRRRLGLLDMPPIARPLVLTVTGFWLQVDVGCDDLEL